MKAISDVDGDSADRNGCEPSPLEWWVWNVNEAPLVIPERLLLIPWAAPWTGALWPPSKRRIFPVTCLTLAPLFRECCEEMALVVPEDEKPCWWRCLRSGGCPTLAPLTQLTVVQTRPGVVCFYLNHPPLLGFKPLRGGRLYVSFQSN